MRKIVLSLIAISALAYTAKADACNCHSYQPRWNFSFSFGSPCEPSICCYDDYCEGGRSVEFEPSRRNGSRRTPIRGSIPQRRPHAEVRTRHSAAPRLSHNRYHDTNVIYYRRGAYR